MRTVEDISNIDANTLRSLYVFLTDIAPPGTAVVHLFDAAQEGKPGEL